MRSIAVLIIAFAACAAVADGQPAGAPAASTTQAAATTRPAARPPKMTNLDRFLSSQTKLATTAPAGGEANSPTSQSAATDGIADAGKSPFGGTNIQERQDAIPGVVQLSDGSLFAGMIYTTAEADIRVWVEKGKDPGEPNATGRWRRVPLVCILSITGVIVEEHVEQQWRWKEMGSPERVYTGKSFPSRRMKWKVHLIDDSTITGDIKGQPIWIESPGDKAGPFVLTETSRGELGQSLKDLVYIKQIVLSRRLMDTVSAQMPKKTPAKQ